MKSLTDYAHDIQNELPPVLAEARVDFLSQHSHLAPPTRKSEAWRYTPISALARLKMQPAIYKSSGLSKDQIHELKAETENEEFYCLVLVNGRIDKTWGHYDELNSFVEMKNHQQYSKAQDYFDVLNQTFAYETTTLHLTQDLATRPLKIIHLNSEPETMVSSRLEIKVGAAVSASIIEDFRYNNSTFANTHTSIAVEASAKLEYLQKQNNQRSVVHFANTQLNLAQQSKAQAVFASTGADVFRNAMEVYLSDRDSVAEIYGATLTRQEQKVDHVLLVDHLVRDTQSTQIFKSIATDDSRVAFAGQIHIAPQAQKVSSEQLSQGLLLSENAEVVSRPQLMIEADDVKAAHGATVGQLQEEEIFYLQSRGLSRAHAREILSSAFVFAIAQKCENRLLQKECEELLRGALKNV